MTTRDGDWIFIEWARVNPIWPWTTRHGAIWCEMFAGHQVWMGSITVRQWRLWPITQWVAKRFS